MQPPRRPGPSPRSAVRRSARARGSTRRAPGAPPGRGPVGLTTRAAALGLVLCALVVSAALPLREYLSQRSQMAQLQQAQTAQQARVAALEEQRTRLDDPAYVASLARERLHYARPGDTTYVVIGGESATTTPAPGAPIPPAGPDAPWWSQLWGSARAADAAPAGR